MQHVITETYIETKATEAAQTLKTRNLRARYHPGDADGATKSALRAARRTGRTHYMYLGNAWGRGCFRVTYEWAEASCWMSNTGTFIKEIRPDNTIVHHTVQDRYVTAMATT